jgi:hypothetical protein
MAASFDTVSLNSSISGASMQAFMTKAAFAFIGFTALAVPATAKESPTKGKFEIRIIADSAANGHTDGDGTAFRILNHHEITATANLIFTHTDANDSVAEGFKDASVEFDAKTKPMANAADKVRSAGLPSANLMTSLEKCSELEDENELQACMMKAASGLQGQMQEKCRKDPSICAAMDALGDEENISEMEAGARDLQEAMTKFRFYMAESCTVDASIDYRRHDQSASESGGLFYADRSSKTNGFVRGIPVRNRMPCELKIAVGPDNTISLSFSLSDTLSFPAQITNPSDPTIKDKVKLETGSAFKIPYLVKKQKSASAVVFNGEQAFAIPAKTVKNGGWTTASSSTAKAFWSIKLD